jgi:6-phosphogluconate dehydrogenase
MKRDGKHPFSGRSADFAIIGLGRMGAGLAAQALERGYRVAGLTKGAPALKLGSGFRLLDAIDQLRGALLRPRKVLLYVPAGATVDSLLDALASVLQRGDVIADGGNSYWGDSIRRHRRLSGLGIGFVDLGTSGGVAGARDGACFMAGGDKRDVAKLANLLKSLAVDGGWVHAGGPGAGHFTKLVHNGIEFGMLQSIGEGLALLEAWPQPLPIESVLNAWRHGSVIRSWLVDLVADAYRRDSGFNRVPPLVEDTGEVNWLIDDALQLETPIPVIAQAVMQLLASRDGPRIAARAVAAMRHGFGGHPYGRNAAIARERRDSRIGGFERPRR